MFAPIVNSTGSADEIVFINLGGNRERAIPLCKVKFATGIPPLRSEKCLLKTKRGEGFWENGNIQQCSFATRVRIEVLWVMAKKIQNEKETATVLGYSSRPTFQVKDKSSHRRPLSLGFMDAFMSRLAQMVERALRKFLPQREVVQIPPAPGFFCMEFISINTQL